MMALPLLLVLAGATPSAAAQPTRADLPSRADLQRVLALVERSGVEVEGPRGRGPGIVVGAGGEVLTTVDFVGPAGATVWRDGAGRAATLVLADEATRFALVRLAQPAELPAVPVRVLADIAPDSWLAAVTSWRAQRYPVKVRVVRALPGQGGGVPHVAVAHALPVGAPLFDPDGRLVALVVRPAGGRRSRGRMLALSLAELQRRLAREEQP
jgi:hypothetical protein